MGDFFWDLTKRITGVVYYRACDIMGVIIVDGKEFGSYHTPSWYRMLWCARTPVITACLLTSRYHPAGGMLGVS